MATVALATWAPRASSSVNPTIGLSRMLPVFVTATETTESGAREVRRRADGEAGRSAARDGDHDGDRLAHDLVEGDGTVAGDRLVVLEDEARDVLARPGPGRDGDLERTADGRARRQGADVGRIVDPARRAGLRSPRCPSAEAAVDDRVDIGRIRPHDERR